VIEVIYQMKPVSWHHETIITFCLNVLCGGLYLLHTNPALGVSVIVVFETKSSDVFIRLNLWNITLLI